MDLLHGEGGWNTNQSLTWVGGNTALMLGGMICMYKLSTLIANNPLRVASMFPFHYIEEELLMHVSFLPQFFLANKVPWVAAGTTTSWWEKGCRAAS